MNYKLVGILAAFMLTPGVGQAAETANDQDASAEVAQSAEKTETTEENLPFGGSLSLSTAVGMGTFANDNFARRPLSTGRIGLSLFYKIADSQRVTASVGAYTYFATNSDIPLERPGQTFLEDVILGYSYSGIWSDKDLGLTFSAGTNFLLPTSDLSQYLTKVITVSPNASLRGAWDWFSATYTLSYSYNFYEYEYPVLENTGSVPICINRDEIVSGACFPGGPTNTQMSFVNSLSLGFKATDELSFGLAYSLITGLGFNSFPEEDDLTSVNAEAGQNQRDSAQGALSASYQVHSNVGVSLAMSTFSPVKTSDTEGYRFPFFDGRANNFTTISLGVTGSY